jgi:hypothetical protein
MKIEAIVHPTSISRKDKKFNPDIHIAVETLASDAFRKKMIGLPVTAYHHDTVRAINLISARGVSLNGSSMRKALIELNATLPKPQDLAKNLLVKKGIPITDANVWRALPMVNEEARGPGVLGSVTDFYRNGDQWMVKLDLNTMHDFQKRLVTKGGALGEISLTHADRKGEIEPLEVSFTIQGLRTGSTINRIISASSKSSRSTIIRQTMSDNTIIVEELPNKTMTDPKDDHCDIRAIYESLSSKEHKEMLVRGVNNIKLMSAAAAAGSNKIDNARLAALEKSIETIQTCVVSALQEIGPHFGAIKPRSTEEWNKDPAGLAVAAEFIFATAAHSLKSRKREHDELDEALSDISGSRLVQASTATHHQAAKIQRTKEPVPDENEAFFNNLRSIRAQWKAME